MSVLPITFSPIAKIVSPDLHDVRLSNRCDFCNTLAKKLVSHSTSPETNRGWVSCEKEECIQHGKQNRANFWFYIAYGKANCLMHEIDSNGNDSIIHYKSINVLRTNGLMESNWTFDPWRPEPKVENGVEIVHVKQQDNGLKKWVSIDDLLIWNDRAPQP